MKIIYQVDGNWVSVCPAPGFSLEWVAENNLPPGTNYEIVEDDDPRLLPPPPPLQDLAPYQFRAMLKLSGKQEALYAVLDALPEPDRTVAQSKLEYSLTFKRDNDLVLAAQGALGLSAKELDRLWLQASSIV